MSAFLCFINLNCGENKKTPSLRNPPPTPQCEKKQWRRKKILLTLFAFEMHTQRIFSKNMGPCTVTVAVCVRLKVCVCVCFLVFWVRENWQNHNHVSYPAKFNSHTVCVPKSTTTRKRQKRNNNANNKYDNHANKQQNSIPPILLISHTHTNTEKAYQNSNRK